MAQRDGPREDFIRAEAGALNDWPTSLAVNDLQLGDGLWTLPFLALEGNSSRECS
jgi:hypothetical protein